MISKSPIVLIIFILFIIINNITAAVIQGYRAYDNQGTVYYPPNYNHIQYYQQPQFPYDYSRQYAANPSNSYSSAFYQQPYPTYQPFQSNFNPPGLFGLRRRSGHSDRYGGNLGYSYGCIGRCVGG